MRALAFLLLASRVALAEPEPEPEPAAPLAQLKDDKQLAASLNAITQDPSIPGDDKTRPLAQALMTEGVKQLQAHHFEQALANFLDAYDKFPSPKILLNIASTLRDMGRLADAANTYQRYLLDPATGSERVAEVKELLIKLDEELTILTVRVFPSGSDISLDGGPFIAVGTSLLTRVRSGIHLVRIRKGAQASEVTLNGFPGENKEVSAMVKDVVALEPVATAVKPPEHVDAWLQTGTAYASAEGDSSTRARHVRTGYAGPEIVAVLPKYDTVDRTELVARVQPDEGISSGALAVLRIDGKGRGFAGGAGIAVASDHIEGDFMVLRSEETGAYIGLRGRFLTGWLRPYVAGGMPAFIYSKTNADMSTSTKLAVGVRGAGGIELKINGHLSVQADLGVEHFFSVSGTNFEATVFVPTLGLIGRL